MHRNLTTLLIFTLALVSFSLKSQTYFSEDFENQNLCITTNNGNACTNGNGFCSLSGGIVNPSSGDDIDWLVLDGTSIIYQASFPVITLDHTTGTSAGKYICINEYSDCFEEIGHLEIPNLNLTNATNPTLTFWYHLYDQFVNSSVDYGTLDVDIFSNGSWSNSIIPTLSPNLGNQWYQSTVDLSAYVGGTITIRFRGETGDHTWSSISLDDITIAEVAVAPVAGFGISNPACQNSTTFTDNSSNAPTSWSWDFGADATPQTATGQGPHMVTYSSNASQIVSLTVTNSAGSNTTTQNFQPAPEAVSDFSWGLAGNTVMFTNLATNANTISWDFGDGSAPSSILNPTYTYAGSGTYNVTLYATNDCGSDSITKAVEIMSGVGLDDQDALSSVNVFPNPSKGFFTLSAEGLTDDVQVVLYDVAGKSLRQWNFTNVENNWNQTVDISTIPSGNYLLEVLNQNNKRIIQLIAE